LSATFYAVALGAWSVPLSAVPDLTILVPVRVPGKSDVVIDLSPLAAIWKGFDAIVAKSGMTTDEGKADTETALSANQKAEMFRLFLTWPQNQLEVEVTMQLLMSPIVH
jgi:hypothetical protein